ncbi:MAG: sigma-70 family RNA polymerase sigma factor [Planctomycetota bacterium]|nr:sigma-70 family RNA polymerase sigma factor [Planctomycetota bacterium]
MRKTDTRQGPGTGRGKGAGLSADQFAERFDESSRVLWTLAAGILGNRTHVEDVLQEAAMIGWRKVTDFDPSGSFSAWMGRVVRFVALNQLRLTRRRNTHPTDPETLDRIEAPRPVPTVQMGPGGEVRLDRDRLGDELSRALADLKPTARACLLLKTVVELEYRQIGAVLGIPEGTAMSHVHRARQLLRKRLATGSVGLVEGS